MLAAGVGLSQTAPLFATDAEPAVRVGLVTDLHHADKKPAGSRHYRESLAKLAEAAKHFEQDKPDLVVELGDLIDRADSVAVEMRYLKRINKDFAALPGEQHYVLGNHCVDTLTKEEFLGEVGQKASYYSFDRGGFHFVVLDACFRSDGEPYGRRNFQWTDPNIPTKELNWLAADLKKTKKKTVVFVHQRLDVKNNHAVKNATAVRKVMEDAGNVLAVFQGHSHQNDYKQINGIHYCVHRAMVEGSGKENSGFSTLDVFPDGTLKLSGHRKQKSYKWSDAKD